MNNETVIQLNEIEQKFIAAWVAGDRSVHERVLTDDWSVIDPSGQVMTKREMLANSFAGDREITLGEIDDVNVRDYGSFAVVTGRTHVVGRFDGAEADITLRFTDVFIRQDNEWRCVASQGTFVQ